MKLLGKMKKLPILLFAALSLSAFGQTKKIPLKNASFEKKAVRSNMPAGWHSCQTGTTPDILPGQWEVVTKPSQGTSFLGLITRDDGTFESIGQRLSEPLKVKGCYTFSADLAYSKTYSGYNQPIKLRIWGATNQCENTQMIVETGFIKNTTWRTYHFRFVPKRTINYIILEAHFKDGSFSHKGNVLIDAFSPIKTCSQALYEQELNLRTDDRPGQG